MNRDKKNILKGVCYGFTGTIVCMMLLGTIKPEPETGVDLNTGESVLLIPGQQSNSLPRSQTGFTPGRYQLSSWSNSWRDGGAYGAFLVDTASGKTKIAYSCLIRKNGKKTVIVDNLGKPFGEILR